MLVFGERIRGNFSKFWTGCRTQFKCYETDDQIKWHVVQTTFKAKIEVEIACNKADMIWINYEAPNGTKKHNKLWNCGNGFGSVKLYLKESKGWKLLDEVYAEHVGCEYGEYDRP